MSARLCLVLVLFLTSCLQGRAIPGQLEGCSDPAVIAKALTQLRQSNWHELTAVRLQAMWPNKLSGVDCDSAACSSMDSKGRIIDGHYDCSEAFYLDVKRNENGEKREQLGDVVINYSAREKRDIVIVAKLFARAAGLSQAEVASVGNDVEQTFHWEVGPGEELAGLGVKFTRGEKVWTLNFNLSRFLK